MLDKVKLVGVIKDFDPTKSYFKEGFFKIEDKVTKTKKVAKRAFKAVKQAPKVVKVVSQESKDLKEAKSAWKKKNQKVFTIVKRVF